jgi:hypothetical protein
MLSITGLCYPLLAREERNNHPGDMHQSAPKGCVRLAMEEIMMRIITSILTILLVTQVASAADTKIESAESAAPESLAKNATIMDWDGKVLRKGSTGWTCLPNRPNNGGNDPWCVDASWINLLDSLKNKKKPTYNKIGIAYMLGGESPVSNITPGGKKEDGSWVDGLKAHLMIVVPDRAMFDNISTDPKNGGPWIMWPDTPYAHIMVPIDSYPK